MLIALLFLRKLKNPTGLQVLMSCSFHSILSSLKIMVWSRSILTAVCSKGENELQRTCAERRRGYPVVRILLMRKMVLMEFVYFMNLSVNVPIPRPYQLFSFGPPLTSDLVTHKSVIPLTSKKVFWWMLLETCILGVAASNLLLISVT